MSFDRNIVTDYGSPNDGSAGFQEALLVFKGQAQGLDSILRIPAGTFDLKGGGPDARFFDGIPTLQVILDAAATITDNAGAGSLILGGPGTDFTVHIQPKIETVLAGSNVVVLKDILDAVKYTVGGYVFVCSFDLQGNWHNGFGAPNNNQWVEPAKVLGISGKSITLDRNLQFTHKSTWPWYSGALQTDGPDQGGPAMLIPLGANWDIFHTYSGGTINFATPNAINCAGRLIVFDGMTIIGARGVNPSVDGEIRFKDCDLQFGMEVDKLLGKIVFEGTTKMLTTGVEFQSASGLLEIRDSVRLHNLNGTPRRTIARGDKWRIENLLMGPHDYGRNDELIFGPGQIDTWGGFGGQHEQGQDGEGVDVSYTMSGGVIRIPNTLGAKPWCVPGTNCYFSGTHTCVVPFIVIDVTQDATFTYVQTNLSGGFPAIAGTHLTIHVHPSPHATFHPSIITTDPQIKDFTLTRAGRPVYEYVNRAYTKANTAGAVSPTPNIFGNLNFLRFNVTSAYAGATNPLTVGLTMTLYAADYSHVTYTALFDLRQTGLREITRAGVTGIKSGETIPNLPDPVYNWLTADGVGQNPSNNVSGDTTSLAWTLEVDTNQGISGGLSFLANSV